MKSIKERVRGKVIKEINNLTMLDSELAHCIMFHVKTISLDLAL